MASRNSRQAIRHEGRPLPFWLGLVVGFALGIIGATVLVYRDWAKERQRDPPATPAAGSNQPAEPRRFEFYDGLPDQQVQVPTPAPAAPVTVSTPAPPPVAPVAADTIYLVVGSFPGAAEADARKAQLALIGVSAKVGQATINGETRYRVLTGPYGDADGANSARSNLKSSGFDAFPVRGQ